MYVYVLYYTYVLDWAHIFTNINIYMYIYYKVFKEIKMYMF